MSGLPTRAQIDARARNWRIRCLRSLWAQCHMLSPNRAEEARSIIDAELRSIGAEGERDRRLRQEAEVWGAVA